MLAIVPIAMSLTLAIAFIAWSALSPGATSYERALAGNMLMQHRVAVEHVLREDVQHGPIPNLLTEPLRNLADWRSQVYVEGGVTLVVTYVGPDTTVAGNRLYGVTAALGADRISGLPPSAIGRFYQNRQRIPGDPASVVPGISPPEGTPIIISEIHENGPG